MRQDKVFIIFSWVTALFLLGLMTFVFGYTVYHGTQSMGYALFFDDVSFWPAVTGAGRVWEGIWPAICGTLSLVFTAMVIAFPLGLATGIYLALFAKRAYRRVALSLIDLLAGVPSVIVGLFGFALLLFLRESFFPQASTSLGLAAGCLAILVLPYLIKLTCSAIDGVPTSLKVCGEALGMTPWQQVWHLLVPAAKEGILEGVILSFGRCAEDTAVILFTGVVANAGLPHGFLGKFEALPFYIFYHTTESQGSSDIALAFGAALVLIMITFVAAIAARRLTVRRHHAR